MTKNKTVPQKQSSQSSDKLLQILEAIASNRTAVRLQDLAEQVGMSQSTVLRYLHALQQANYVYQEEDTSRYALTWKVCCLTQNVNSFLSLRNITGPFINQMLSELHLGICLVIEQEYECVYLDCIDNEASMAYTLQRIGKRAPLHTTGSGKILLSRYTEAQIDEYIAMRGLTKLTDNTITDRTVLMRELEKVTKQGFAMDEEECELGLRCISMPLRDYSGKIAAALSVFGNLTDMNQPRIENEVLPLLQKVSTIISERLGFSSNQNGNLTISINQRF